MRTGCLRLKASPSPDRTVRLHVVPFPLKSNLEHGDLGEVPGVHSFSRQRRRLRWPRGHQPSVQGGNVQMRRMLPVLGLSLTLAGVIASPVAAMQQIDPAFSDTILSEFGYPT